jgi:hypothetical protein
MFPREVTHSSIVSGQSNHNRPETLERMRQSIEKAADAIDRMANQGFESDQSPQKVREVRDQKV